MIIFKEEKLKKISFRIASARKENLSLCLNSDDLRKNTPAEEPRSQYTPL